MCLAQGPQRSDIGEAPTHGPSVSSQAHYHWATALPWKYYKCSVHFKQGIKWASTQENLSLVVCKQQRRRPAWTSTQSDQCLCCSLIRKYKIKIFYMQNFIFLANLCSWAGCFWYDLIGNPKDRFSRIAAQTAMVLICQTTLIILSSVPVWLK